MSDPTRWCRVLVGGLVAAGMDHFFVSPGSRSTPLTLAVHALGPDAYTVIADERSAAFAALGHARVTGRPAGLLATSGTAAAHWFPAILEAEAAHIPLVAISADRPIELQDAGASQTLDQVRLFGTHVRKSFELGAPDAAVLPRAGELAARIVAAASSPIAGPVHVNARFRKPLEPSDAEADRVTTRAFFHAALGPSREAVAFMVEAIVRSERPCLVAGPWPYGAGRSRRATGVRLRAALHRLQRSTRIAVLAESTSGLPATLGTALEARLLSGAQAPDLVLEVGSFPVLGGYATPRPGRRIAVAPSTLVDPVGDAAAHILSDPLLTLEALADALEGHSAPRHVADATARLERRVQAAKLAVSAQMGAALEGPQALSQVTRAQPEDASLLIGNSLVARDLEAYGQLAHADTLVLHQRGAAGIDGLIAGAFGTSLATASPTTVVLGDVSALHDAGSFHLLSRVKHPLVVVVVDDDGGHIFDALPIADHLRSDSEAYRVLYLTPPPQGCLRGIASAFGLGYREPESIHQLSCDLADALSAANTTVIRVRVDAAASRAQRAALQRIAQEAAHAVD